MNEEVFEGVQNFRYLRALINRKKCISNEIKSRTAAGNRCFYNLRQIFKSRAISKTVKIKICKSWRNQLKCTEVKHGFSPRWI
jgi:hypothetical protein